MKRRPATRGFTIIESLIFLSISGFIFIAAIGGYTMRQREAQFTQGVRDLQARIQDVINDVGSGFYPQMPLECHAQAVFPTNPTPFFDADSTNSSNCVWLGKALQLGRAYYCNPSVDSAECGDYSLIPIVARRTITLADGSKELVNNLAQAKPISLSVCLTNGDNPDSGPCSGTRARPDLAGRGSLAGSIGVYRVFVRGDSNGATVASQTGALVFLSSFNGSSDQIGRASGVNLAYISNSAVDSTEPAMTDRIESTATFGDANLNPPHGITLCIKGAYGQKAAITVGAGGRQLDVQVKREGDIDAGCN